MSALEAARFGDEIGHTHALLGFLAGAVVGALFAVAIIALTGGAALVVVAGAVLAGAGSGALAGAELGATCDAERVGPIATGSSTVIIGRDSRRAARAGVDLVQCKQHDKKLIAQGSETVVFGEGPGAPLGLAARKSERTQCDGKISEGWATVLIGGPTQTVVEIEPEVPVELRWLAIGMIVVGGGLGIIAGLAAGVTACAVGAISGGVISFVGGKIGEWVGAGIGGLFGGKGAERGRIIGGFFGGDLFSLGVSKLAAANPESRFAKALKSVSAEGVHDRQRIAQRARNLEAIRNKDLSEIRRIAAAPGMRGDQIEARMLVAKEFYYKNGYKPSDIRGHLSGTDFTKPVKTYTLNGDTTFNMAQAPGGRPGNYLAKDAGTEMSRLGIGPLSRNRATGEVVPKQVSEVTVKGGTTVLESTSSPKKDFWSISASGKYAQEVQSSKGGAQQIVTPKTGADPDTGNPAYVSVGPPRPATQAELGAGTPTTPRPGIEDPNAVPYKTEYTSVPVRGDGEHKVPDPGGSGWTVIDGANKAGEESDKGGKP
ncbi:MAG: hypothetical protein HOW73_22030 [Polyangiaceae bacterium]|nr:hypothetical protein [Polyangiaceae bacterium]